VKSARILAHGLLHIVGMFVRRCGWHRKYHGYAKILGVSSWQGRGVTFSDGLCADCAARARAESRLLAAAARPVATGPARRVLRPAFAFASVALLGAVGATLGVLLGPPQRQTVSQSTAPVPTVVASKEATPKAGATSVSSTRPASARTRVVDAGGAASVSSQIAEAPAERERGPLTRPAAFVRVSRAAARRTGVATYRSASVAMPAEIVSAPEPPIEASEPAPVRWAANLSHVELQVP
jgi:hypothetical protein